MARASMATLITRVRTLISDPSGASQTFSDDQIQDALDMWRTERRWVPLIPQPTFIPGGSVQYLDYYSDTGAWESDIQLQDASYNTLTPTTSELLVGHFAFTSVPQGSAVSATGKTYDVYASAADLLESWAASVKLDFNVQTGRDVYSRMQKFDMINTLARRYRALAQPRSGRLVQSDSAGFDSGVSVTYPSSDRWD